MFTSRRDVLDAYDSVRSMVKRVTVPATSCCSGRDIMRGARALGLLHKSTLIADSEDERDLAMEIAMFEPNERGSRAIDRFVRTRRQTLPADVAAFAERLAQSRVTAVRVIGRHELAGLWLEDLLDGGRRIWLVDRSLERTAHGGCAFVVRPIDAGPFHIGFQFVAPLDAGTVANIERDYRLNGRTPFDHRFTAEMYQCLIELMRSDRRMDEELKQPASSAA